MPLTVAEIVALQDASDAAESRVWHDVREQLQKLRETLGAPEGLPEEPMPEHFALVKQYQHYLMLELGERGVIETEDAEVATALLLARAAPAPGRPS